METMTADHTPIINVWQARGLIDLMGRFYSDPKNQAAYEKWKSERDHKHE